MQVLATLEHEASHYSQALSPQGGDGKAKAKEGGNPKREDPERDDAEEEEAQCMREEREESNCQKRIIPFHDPHCGEQSMHLYNGRLVSVPASG